MVMKPTNNHTFIFLHHFSFFLELAYLESASLTTNPAAGKHLSRYRLRFMDEGKSSDRKIGSVKAAITSYELEGTPTTKKILSNYPEKSYTKRRELHQAKRDTNQFDESRKLAESVTAEAESNLSAAKKMIKDLTHRIEESNTRVKSELRDLEKLKMAKRRGEELSSEDFEFVKVLKELESIKLEISKLKLDMASIQEEKRMADKETESSLSKTEPSSRLISSLTKEVEDVNEEHVLVELARIEAIKEYKEIEAQKREEAIKHLEIIEDTSMKRQNMVQEIEDAKDVETKLAITTSDINMLEGELKQIKEADKNFNKNDSEYENLLDAVLKELEETKRELDSVKDESFQFMASIHVVRNELSHVMEETTQIKRKEDKTAMAIQNLSTKLLRAKTKLEATSTAEDKSKSIVSNLLVSLERLKSEAETAKTERSLIGEETATIKIEIQKTDKEIDLAEEKLQAAVQELKAVKSSEALALHNLKEIIENTIRNRASASNRGSTINISKFEYEYLKGHAAEAKEIADKKVAAAQAWIEALKASEREIVIKTEQLRRESRELRVEGKNESRKSETLSKEVKVDFEKWRPNAEPENLQPEIAVQSKATNKSVRMTTPARRLKSRKSVSPLIRVASRATSSTNRKREKVVSNISQIFNAKGKNQ